LRPLHELHDHRPGDDPGGAALAGRLRRPHRGALRPPRRVPRRLRALLRPDPGRCLPRRRAVPARRAAGGAGARGGAGAGGLMDGISIVGMACRYPDADSPDELWRNVLAQRRAFRRLPAERLRMEDYFSPDPSAPDRSYALQAAVLEGLDFDRVRFRISVSTYRSADLAL